MYVYMYIYIWIYIYICIYIYMYIYIYVYRAIMAHLSVPGRRAPSPTPQEFLIGPVRSVCSSTLQVWRSALWGNAVSSVMLEIYIYIYKMEKSGWRSEVYLCVCVCVHFCACSTAAPKKRKKLISTSGIFWYAATWITSGGRRVGDFLRGEHKEESAICRTHYNRCCHCIKSTGH